MMHLVLDWKRLLKALFLLIDHIELTGITGAILMDNLDVCRLADAPLEVEIDLKPENADNVVDPFNLNSNKPVEVAVFSTADFDATTLDSSTVELGDPEPILGPLSASIEDVDGDDLLDMIFDPEARTRG